MKNQLGRSMIEMLGVLAIIGVLSVGGIAGYSKAMMKWKTNKTIEQIENTITRWITLSATQPSSFEITCGDNKNSNILCIDLGFITKEMTIDTWPYVVSPFNTDYYFTIRQRDTLDLDIEVPREACIALATTIWANKDIAIAVTGGIQYPGYPSSDCSDGGEINDGFVRGCSTDNSYPISPSIAAKACTCYDRDCEIRLSLGKMDY